tara:strand:- start:1153 stop:2466 length:1314 start_codon:yes stop_codon:yes gene_type:complete
MNVLHIGKSDLLGGASKASYRIHQSIKNNANLSIKSKMRVIKKISLDEDIISKNNPFHNNYYPKFITLINKIYRYGLRTENPVIHSTAILNTGLAKELNHNKLSKDIDIFHLHWLGDITMSIEEIGSLAKPIVWTLHDQWPFCGAEHYVYLDKKNNLIDKRYYDNYSKDSRLGFEYGKDINRITWLRKEKNWKKNIYIVCPSKWMTKCAKKSSLFRNNPIFTIPNPLDTKSWAPIDQLKAKNYLNISSSKKIILFGAINIINDARKGAKLLFDALRIFRKISTQDLQKKIILLAFGQDLKDIKLDTDFPIRFTGHISDNKKLNIIYSAADVFVNPSLQESFGQTGSEAHSCATPVLAFKNSGLADIVDHLKTGYLAEPFNTFSLAEGIRWILEDEKRNKNLGANARLKALKNWDYAIVSKMYSNLYEKIKLNQENKE